MTPTEIAGARVKLRPSFGGYQIREGEEVVGEVRVRRRQGAVTIECLQVDERRRGYGIGSDAARTLVRWMEEQESPLRVRAWAPPDRGLAVYFWFRMGFRPVHGAGPEGGLWLERVNGGVASV